MEPVIEFVAEANIMPPLPNIVPPLHLMVDCETLSTKTNPVILSLGAVAFDPTGKISTAQTSWYHFYRTIQRRGQRELGRHVDPETALWWFQQDDAALASLFSEQSIPLPYALTEFARFCTSRNVDTIWSYGATADIVWLETAFRDIGVPFPFVYRRLRCFRTLTALADVERPKMVNGDIKHHALHDAINQAEWAIDCYAKLFPEPEFRG